MSERTIYLLGPQRLAPTLSQALSDAGVAGPLAVVTAGWEERESEDSELRDHVGCEIVNLGVHQRVEEIFQHDRELLEGMRERHDTMRRLQQYYRVQLSYALECARDLMKRQDDRYEDLLGSVVLSAIESVRMLDYHHLGRLREVHAEFDERWRPAERPHVARQREEVQRLLDGCTGLCIAGGHVAILLNRLRVLGLPHAAPDMPLFAWSAGAMALSDRVVLFHDSPPQGPGDAEVMEAGLGIAGDVVALPHAKRRLRLDDGTRVALFARRFGPALCVALDEETGVFWDGQRWAAWPGTQQLGEDGLLADLEAA